MQAQELYARPSTYISGFVGQSQHLLGSQDARTDFGVGMAWARREPHFKWRHGPSQLVWEAYYEHSNGDTHPRGKVTDAIGALWYARFRFPTHGVNLFGDIGIGAQLASSESFDLGTRLNSTPMAGLGFALRQGSHEILLGIRYLHVSNASLNASNRGQNQILIYVAAKI